MTASTVETPNRRPRRADRAGERARTGGSTRWDIQGLRAFAVLAVVLYHLWPNRLPGGFVGVDVFFVISGFLITGHLVRERVTTGRIGLAGFWARRAKRLLPGAFLAILATGVAVLLWAPSSLWGQYGRELVASTLYAQNWQLASDSVNYLAQGNQASPFQHFWSLSVEEQFYIALPLLLLLVLWIVRAGRRGTRAVVTTVRLVLLAVVVLSFAWCLVQTHTSSGVAYFSTATRAWEFALGGLASTVPLSAPRTAPARVVRVVGAWLGAAGLVAALFVITPDTPFPGVAAALPVLSATLVVLFGGHAGMQPLGAFRPVAFTGRISYAVYLWHWPAVVLMPLALRHELTTKDKVAILVASFLVASASTLLVEEPLRFSRWVRRIRPRRVALLGALSTVVVLALGAATLTAVHVQEVQAADFAKRLTTGDVRCFGAAALVGSSDPCVNPALADVRVPRGAAIGQDDANSGRSDCWSNTTDDVNVCSVGPAKGATKHLLAIGDSHNNALLDTYERIADAHHWRIDVTGHIGCYLTTTEQQAGGSDALIDVCNRWKQRAIAYVRAHPDLDGLIVTHSTFNSPVIPAAGVSAQDATVSGMVEAWKAAIDNGVPVVALRDNPVASPDVVTCVSQMTGPTTNACDTSRGNAFATFDGSAQAVEQSGPLARYIDLTQYYCNATHCPSVIGGVVVHRDQTHLTNTFAKTLAPYLGREIASALRSAGS